MKSLQIIEEEMNQSHHEKQHYAHQAKDSSKHVAKLLSQTNMLAMKKHHSEIQVNKIGTTPLGMNRRQSRDTKRFSDQKNSDLGK